MSKSKEQPSWNPRTQLPTYSTIEVKFTVQYEPNNKYYTSQGKRTLTVLADKVVHTDYEGGVLHVTRVRDGSNMSLDNLLKLQYTIDRDGFIILENKPSARKLGYEYGETIYNFVITKINGKLNGELWSIDRPKKNGFQLRFV